MPAPTPSAQRRQEMLDHLLDCGMHLIDAMTARADEDRAALPKIARAYERVSGAIRRGLLLHERLEQNAAAPDKHIAARRKIIRAVEESIERLVPSKPEADSLTAELHERLDGPDLVDEIGVRPDDQIIRDLSRDLGLDDLPGERFHKRRTPADIARLCARAAQPSPAASGHAASAPAASSPAPSSPANEPERFYRTIPSPNAA